MGICGSKQLDEYAYNSVKIDQVIKADRERLRNEIKILLLGSGESGKSTIVKQMKIMYQDGFSQAERLAFVPLIYRNILEAAQELSIGFKTCQIEPKSEENKEFVDKLYLLDIDSIMNIEIGEDTITGIENLWKDPALQELLPRTSEFYLMDSAKYFFQNIRRICGSENYQPNNIDILRSRSKTTGIIETRFPMGNKTIHMFDVGGQRSERKKWIHCFEEVTSILFCVAVSEYDQVLLEESSRNRMEESLALFQSIVNSNWFIRSSIILFLNKIDVFKEKIEYSPLSSVYPEYTGGADVSLATTFILWKFQTKNRLNLPIYPHLTEATSTSNIRVVFAYVKETLLQNALKDSGIL
ncbi:hypothetical protein BB559_002197 [Furculomyces boomerangus]|uniref:Guanine nucleotide-binding protein subunit alpha n=2 Tax=Harpellales TaxID=61421 RepID=A0A2T9YX70_9FUNG|nr:hypothetical protein BB559_002197 [Furculomyces boomerangus]PVZ99453.1 hypothetical protein BB558_004439 [Smittium angustum]